jgi:ketol-acid reductoisomerase
LHRIISDTAEYGCYLFDHACKPLLSEFMKTIEINVIGKPFSNSNAVDNKLLIAVNQSIRQHPIEVVGAWLRESMTEMKKIG